MCLNGCFVLREFSRVRELNKLAKSSLGKSSFGKGVLRLVTSEGHFLDDLDETPRKQLCQTEQLSCWGWVSNCSQQLLVALKQFCPEASERSRAVKTRGVWPCFCWHFTVFHALELYHMSNPQDGDPSVGDSVSQNQWDEGGSDPADSHQLPMKWV